MADKRAADGFIFNGANVQHHHPHRRKANDATDNYSKTAAFQGSACSATSSPPPSSP